MYIDLNQTNRLKQRRKLWLSVHLWLGLLAGAVLLLIGLTGSILVFWQEIDALLNPELRTVTVSPAGEQAYQPLQKIVASAQSVLPASAKMHYGYYPRDAEGAFAFSAEIPTSVPGESDTWDVFVDPYSARVLGKRLFYSEANPLENCFIGLMFKLHYALLLNETGVLIVGWLCVLYIISVLTGLIVWWPLTGKWRQAISIKRRASVERLNHDLHKSAGFYFALVLLAVFISGVCFNLNDQFRWLVDQFSVTSPLGSFKSLPQPNAMPITLDQALAIADKRYPDGRLYWFSMPKDETGVYVLTKHYDFGGVFRGRRQIVLDRYSGELLHVADPLIGKGGDIFMQWQWPLHSGQVMRLPGRLLVLLSGLCCALLFVTGFIRWRQKQRAKRVRSYRESKVGPYGG